MPEEKEKEEQINSSHVTEEGGEEESSDNHVKRVRTGDSSTENDPDSGDAPSPKRRAKSHDVLFRIVVPSKQVGRVIGKEGNNRIRTIREGTKACIKIADAVSDVGSSVLHDYTEEFATNIIFSSRDDLVAWARDVGRRNGFVIVIKSSDAGGNGRRPRIKLACERFGAYTSRVKSDTSMKKVVDTTTKKCNCPFLLRGKKLATDDDWMVIVECGIHNHAAAEYLEGHSYAGRLTEEETQILVEMSKSNVRPRDILNTIKERDAQNVSTMKTIYNARHRQKVVEKGGRSQMQLLMMKLIESQYIEWHRCIEGTDCVTDLFWADPISVDLLRCFPSVLIMDCTYKTNRCYFPLLEIVGITSTNLTFSVAFVYLESENEDSYKWALERLKELLDGWPLPSVIVTDGEIALMNALSHVFPSETILICRWHIEKNLVANTKKMFAQKDEWETFMNMWQALVASETESKYVEHLNVLDSDYSSYPSVLAYVKDVWLDKYKEKFVAAWTNEVMHFGSVTTNMAESAHTKLKRHLGSSQGNFETFWTTTHQLLLMQHIEIKTSFEKSLYTVQHSSKPSIFKELLGFVSRSALDKILEELKRSEDVGLDQAICGCVLRKTHGLPCAHEIFVYHQECRPIPLSLVHAHWKKLDLIPSVVGSKVELSCAAEIEAFMKRFESTDTYGKAILLRKLKELSNPSSTSLLDMGTRREPSLFEHVLFARDSTSSKSMVHFVQARKLYRARSLKPQLYIDQFPVGLRPYIQQIKDVLADGNCGYRTVAALMDMGENNWTTVREELMEELEAFKDHYNIIFGSTDRVNELYCSLNYFDSPAPDNHWMTMPEMGHVIASKYNVVLLHLSNSQCLTFLPLRSKPTPISERRVIGIGFINSDHFVQVFVSSTSPIPPIASNWAKFHYPIARGWDTPYLDRILHFTSLIGTEVTTQETISLDSD